MKRVAYVVPADYGWGFRREDDTMWGIWSADGNATKIWNDINKYTQTYGDNFDIIYNSPLTFFTWKNHYSKLIRWND
jgi:hypothetical protein